MKKNYEKIIIGGGASGMVAAISSKRAKLDTLIIESKDILGKKIYSTGNGRCNYTNENQDVSNYYCKEKSFVTNALNKFSEKDTINFFRDLGVEPISNDGYIYPRSYQAKSLVNALTDEIKHLGIDVLLNTKIKEVEKINEGFRIVTENNDVVETKNIIVATGLKGSAFAKEECLVEKICNKFSVKYNEILPALVKLKVDNEHWKSLAGVRAKGKASILVNGVVESSEYGEIQFTEDSISGIPIFQLSSIASKAIRKNKKVEIIVNFLYDIETEKQNIGDYLNSQKTKVGYKKAKNFLSGLLNDKIAVFLLRQTRILENIKAKEIEDEKFNALVQNIRSFKVKIVKPYDYLSAQTCTGGVDVEELDENMQCKKLRGLFFIGEAIDVDGKCGGYNLQWAWTSGYIAGSKK